MDTGRKSRPKKAKVSAARGRATRTRTSAPSPERSSGARRFVYSFGPNGADGNRTMRDLLGGKGANLAEMCNLGLPVPPGFTISTEVCSAFYAAGKRYPKDLDGQVRAALERLESAMGKRFGDPRDPLLVSVRSGARVSMPGMMDTVLNLGLCDATAAGLAARSGNERFAWDAYRRFVQMYSEVVLEVKARDGEHRDPFSATLDDLKRRRRAAQDTELRVEDLRSLVVEFKRIASERTGHPFPDDPMEQLWGAIGAVFGSWQCDRAIAYRQMNGIPSSWGTAVSVVAMVFGNMGANSGTGVAFTRDPASGEKRFYGEYLMDAQGEDVVAGIRTPQPIAALEKSSPKAFRDLLRIQKKLERHYRDMQDLEFTIEDGRLFMLQCRTGKRTGFAAVRIAVDMVRERLISKQEALARIDPESLDQLLQPVFDETQREKAKLEGRVLTKGLNAGPGAATGHIVFDAGRAEASVADGRGPVVLVRIETSPEDIRGMKAASGILTARGGMTSHAALVARQMGRVCVAGAGDLDVDYDSRSMTVAGRTLREGDWISLDGTTGEVFEGALDTRPSEVIAALLDRPAKSQKSKRAKAKVAVAKKKAGAKSAVLDAFEQVMKWSDEYRTLGVRANADQPDQSATAVALGAEGIGLCRTEHMFFEGEKIDAVRKMIMAESTAERELALAELLPLQRRDFEGIFAAMGPRPVTIRTLDPPLHEFLPHDEETIRDLAKDMGVSPARLHAKVEALHETNPMLGHRGCRLGISYPEITRMQARAVFEAACNVAHRTGAKPRPEIMIPLVGTSRELALQEALVREVAAEVFAAKKIEIPYLVGTMIELPRAALTAGEIAAHAEFFSFGTNDLTQTTFGISRDDGAKFVPTYVDQEIFPADPFATLDTQGVGRLMDIAVADGRAARADLKIGICGEHGGDPRSIAFCHRLGLDYVSCSPFRVPIARLAAAQAALAAAV